MSDETSFICTESFYCVFCGRMYPRGSFCKVRAKLEGGFAIGCSSCMGSLELDRLKTDAKRKQVEIDTELARARNVIGTLRSELADLKRRIAELSPDGQKAAEEAKQKAEREAEETRRRNEEKLRRDRMVWEQASQWSSVFSGTFYTNFSEAFAARPGSNSGPSGYRYESTQPSTPECFRVLGLTSGATKQQVRGRFRELAKVKHPDVCGSQAEFIKIRKAYEEAMRSLDVKV